MTCECDKIHDRLSFATLKHLAGLLDDVLERSGIKSASDRENICGSFLFHTAYFLDNQWVAFDNRRFRPGLCYQEFTEDAFKPEKAIVTDYAEGEMLHEAAIGISETHFTHDETTVPGFAKIDDVYLDGKD